MLEQVTISFSRGSSWTTDRTQVSCIAGRRFTVWATREALIINKKQIITNTGDSVKILQASYTASKNVNWYNHFGKQFVIIS